MQDAVPPGAHCGTLYRSVCLVIALLGWLPTFLTRPMIHGGTLFDVVFMWSGVVLGGYCTLELIRGGGKANWVWVPWLLPYAGVTAAALLYGIQYIPRIFTA